MFINIQQILSIRFSTFEEYFSNGSHKKWSIMLYFFRFFDFGFSAPGIFRGGFWEEFL